MSLLESLGLKKEAEKKGEILPVIPEAVYETGILELQDVIAPSAPDDYRSCLCEI